MRNYLFLILLLAGALLSAQPAFDPDTPLPVDPELITGKLANGLTYYIKVNRTPAKRAELRLVVNIGSVHEDEDQQGLAHFTEHMAFNGTKHFAKMELVDYLNSIGMGYAGGLNAGTGMDQTVYQLKIPTDDAEQFRKGVLILSDWSGGLSFDPDEIERERGVIIEEWRMGQGADQRMYDTQRKVIFAGSRYAERMPIGKLEVLQSFEHDTIRRFYRDWYRPDLQAVVAVGDFDPTMVENLIKEYFGPIPLVENPRECVLYDVPDHIEPKAVVASDPEASSSDIQITWKHDITPNSTFSDYRATLVTNLYTQMLNQRLQELTQQAEPPFSMAYNFKYNMVRSKATYAMVGIVPDTGILNGCRVLLTEAERIKQYGFTQSELDRAKQTALRNNERMLAEKDKQESNRLVWRYVMAYTYGNPVMSIEQNVALNSALYDGITLDDVNRMALELVKDENMVITASAPQKEGLVLPTEAQLLALVEEVSQSTIEPYQDEVSEEELFSASLKPGRIVREKKLKKVGIRQWTLSNGITVLARPTDFKNDEILLRAFSPGGTSLYSLEDLFEAQESASLVAQSGVGSFDQSALDKKLAGKIVRVEPYVENQREGFTGNCSPADLETLFQLIYLYATQPRLDEESFTSGIAKQKAWLENQRLDPQSVFFDSLSAFLYDNHPRARTLRVEDLPGLDRERTLQIYRERFADFSDFTFIFVGSFDLKQLKQLCARYLANLPAHGLREQVADDGMRYTAGIKTMTINRGRDQKSVVSLGLSGSCLISSQTREELRNLTFLMDEKLRENIRESRSGVYFVGAWDYLSKHPEPTYQISIYMQCAPDRVTELTDAVVVTLDSLKAGLFTQKYANVVKVTRQKRFETDVRDNRWWLSTIVDYAWNGFPLKGLLDERKQVGKLDLTKLQAIARKYLIHDASLVTGILYPAPQYQE